MIFKNNNNEQTETINCRNCGKAFDTKVWYDQNGFLISFVPKYCNKCDITLAGVSGSPTLQNAPILQKNVVNLEQDISTLTEGVMMRRDEFNAFKKEQLHFNDCANKDMKECERKVTNLMDYCQMLSVEILRIDNNLNDTKNVLSGALKSLEKFTIEVMIMFFVIILLFSIDLITIWFYIRK